MELIQSNPLNTARQFVSLVRTHGSQLLSRRPELVPKLALNFVRMNAFGQDVMRTLSLNIESGCNATCNHCSADHIMEQTDIRDDRLNIEELTRTIEGCLRAGAVSINITGGEPLLHPQILDIIRAVPRHRGVPNIQTNGLLLTDSMAKELADAGLYITMISLHSHKPEVHDELLNVPGAFDKVMEAIDNCHRHNIPVILNCTLTSQKVADGTLWEMVRLAKDKDVTVNFVQPCTTGKWEDQLDVRLSPEDYEEFDKAMKLPWVVWEGKSNYKHNGCRPGIERIYVSSSGDVIPCAFIHLNFGNVRKESVSTIWARLRNFEYFRQTQQRCMASNDEQFYDEYVSRIAAHPDAMLPIEEHPSYIATNPEEAASVVR
ncbi:MAG: radical SAM protein [Proteobacteria bacterium]|nr:radical SAM protein [Pseudomonadota bacterium]